MKMTFGKFEGIKIKLLSKKYLTELAKQDLTEEMRVVVERTIDNTDYVLNKDLNEPIFDFGKYKGKRYLEILRKDKDYLYWLNNNTNQSIIKEGDAFIKRYNKRAKAVTKLIEKLMKIHSEILENFVQTQCKDLVEKSNEYVYTYSDSERFENEFKKDIVIRFLSSDFNTTLEEYLNDNTKLEYLRSIFDNKIERRSRTFGM